MMRTANRTHPGSIAELCQRPATPPQMTESLCDALVRILIWALGVSLLGTVIASIIRRRGLRQARIVAIVLGCACYHLPSRVSAVVDLVRLNPVWCDFAELSNSAMHRPG